MEEESTATLECEVSRENAEVRWFRDGQDIRKTKKYEMIIDGRKRALLIHDCTLDDSRTYTCDAKDFKTSCFLNVEREYSCEIQNVIEGTFLRVEEPSLYQESLKTNKWNKELLEPSIPPFWDP